MVNQFERFKIGRKAPKDSEGASEEGILEAEYLSALKMAKEWVHREDFKTLEDYFKALDKKTKDITKALQSEKNKK